MSDSFHPIMSIIWGRFWDYLPTLKLEVIYLHFLCMLTFSEFSTKSTNKNYKILIFNDNFQCLKSMEPFWQLFYSKKKCYTNDSVDLFIWSAVKSFQCFAICWADSMLLYNNTGVSVSLRECWNDFNQRSKLNVILDVQPDDQMLNTL